MFYAIEGVDGAGKTTIASEVKKILTEIGEEVWITQEPYKDDYTTETNPLYKLARIHYDRYLHVRDIKDKLNDNPHTIILTDRYTMSTDVYQRVVDGINDVMITPYIEAFEKTLYPLRWFVIIAQPDILAERRPDMDSVLINKLLTEYRYWAHKRNRSELWYNNTEKDLALIIVRIASVIYALEYNVFNTSNISEKFHPKVYMKMVYKNKFPKELEKLMLSNTFQKYYHAIREAN